MLEASTLEATRRDRPRVLVVDDDPDFGESLRMLLAIGIDATVAVEVNPAQALLRLDDSPVSLIITDFQMPQMNGIRFLERANLLSPHTPSILVTGNRSFEFDDGALERLGVQAVLFKPCDPAEVLRLVAKLVGPTPKGGAPRASS